MNKLDRISSSNGNISLSKPMFQFDKKPPLIHDRVRVTPDEIKGLNDLMETENSGDNSDILRQQAYNAIKTRHDIVHDLRQRMQITNNELTVLKQWEDKAKAKATTSTVQNIPFKNAPKRSRRIHQLSPRSQAKKREQWRKSSAKYREKKLANKNKTEEPIVAMKDLD